MICRLLGDTFNISVIDSGKWSSIMLHLVNHNRVSLSYSQSFTWRTVLAVSLVKYDRQRVFVVGEERTRRLAIMEKSKGWKRKDCLQDGRKGEPRYPRGTSFAQACSGWLDIFGRRPVTHECIRGIHYLRSFM